jgi:biopolymer transport protein ExbB
MKYGGLFMAHDFSLLQVIVKGGWTIGLLLLLSVAVFAVFFERWRAFRRAAGDPEVLLHSLRSFLESKDLSQAIGVCEDDGSIAGRVAGVGIRAAQAKQPRVPAMEREAKSLLLSLEMHLPILGTIGNIAPFVGLFGTVLGIIRAFKDLALSNTGGAAVVSQGIAEALIATAAGLFVAITAVIIFNGFQTRLDRMARSIEVMISELDEKLAG